MRAKSVIAPGYYRDRNHVVVVVHGTDADHETVTYSRVNYEWAITTAAIIFRSRFIRLDA